MQGGINQRVNCADCVDRASPPDGQTLVEEHIDPGDELNTMELVSNGLNDVEAPDAVWMFRSKADARPVYRREAWLCR